MKQLQDRLKYQFNNQDLLKTALTHRSAGINNNERLEFLGDAILGCAIAEVLFEKVEHADEGKLSRMRSALVKKESLAQIGKALDIGSIMELGAGEVRSGGRKRDSIIADAVEAIIAAVFLDSNIEQAKQLIARLYGDRLKSLDPERQFKDPKTQLQELLQRHKHPLPQYDVIKISGDQHDQEFEVSCSVEKLSLKISGKGGSRRKAEQAAAEAMLKRINESKL